MRSNEKSPNAATRTPAAVKSTERITWIRHEAWFWFNNYNTSHRDDSNTIPRHGYEDFHSQREIKFQSYTRQAFQGAKQYALRKNLCGGPCFAWKESRNQNSKRSESFNGDIHWDINPFQASKSKRHICIVEQRDRKNSLSCLHIKPLGFRVSHASTKVNK